MQTKKRYEYVLRMPNEIGVKIKNMAKINRRKINDELLIAVENHVSKNKIKIK